MITLEQAKALKYGQILYHVTNRNADGTPERWRVSGQVKTRKARPNEVRVPVAHGLRSYDYITHNELELFCLTEKWAMCGQTYEEIDKASADQVMTNVHAAAIAAAAHAAYADAAVVAANAVVAAADAAVAAANAVVAAANAVYAVANANAAAAYAADAAARAADAAARAADLHV